MDGFFHQRELVYEVIEAGALVAQQGGDLAEHVAHGRLQAVDAVQGLLDDGGEGEKTESVSSGRCVENNDIVFHVLDLLHQLRE